MRGHATKRGGQAREREGKGKQKEIAHETQLHFPLFPSPSLIAGEEEEHWNNGGKMDMRVKLGGWG